MKKFKINTPCVLFNLKEHLKIKKKLTSLINTTKKDSLTTIDEYHSDLIHNLDFNYSTNFSREWVVFLLKYLNNYFQKISLNLGYQKCLIRNIWFQQYKNGGQHGWHTHGGNYTGVYYLNFSNKCARTEIVDPFSQNKKITINAVEGDVVIFPSYVIHRAPKQTNRSTKTIISFNLDFDKPNQDVLNKILNLKSYDAIKR
jgi:hypothetical protein